VLGNESMEDTRRLKSTKMRMLHMICGKTVRDKVRNEEFRDRTEVEIIDEHLRGLGFLGLSTPLFVKVPRPGDSEGTFSVFGLRIKLPPVTTSLTTQGRGNPVKCLAQRHNKRTCRRIPTLTLLNAERQAGKL